MHEFKQNIINVFGDKGKDWLTHLPSHIEKTCTHWGLSSLMPVDNMTFHYVAKAIDHNGQPVVLKMGCDKKLLNCETRVLRYFNGHGSIKLIDHNTEFDALLLQQAIPGTSLKSIYPEQSEFVMDCYVTTMQKLHARPLPKDHNYPHIQDWLQALDKMTSNQIPKKLLDKAIQIKNGLLASLNQEIVLHGDLHHDNILKNENEWLAIDPKGIIGEPEFEVAAFDFIHHTQFVNSVNIKELFETRVNHIAQQSHMNVERIKKWVFVRLILMTAWSIEDNCDLSWAVKLAELVFSDTF